MSSRDLTCWTVIRGAAVGDSRARDDFARRYEPVVRADLAACWRASDRIQALDDAVQEVFIECFAARGRVGLLRLRFHDGLPIREYARARQEFRAALAAVVAFHNPCTPAEVERTGTELLALLK
jgi:hypothetical protein